jgi:hypothetical protein
MTVPREMSTVAQNPILSPPWSNVYYQKKGFEKALKTLPKYICRTWNR